MKVYLCGKMRGIKDLNFPRFLEAAKTLRDMGFTVFNPAEHDMMEGLDPSKDEPKELKHYMVHDLPEVCKADMLVVLDGWETSVGACLEIHVAKTCGITVVRMSGLEPIE